MWALLFLLVVKKHEQCRIDTDFSSSDALSSVCVSKMRFYAFVHCQFSPFEFRRNVKIDGLCSRLDKSETLLLFCMDNGCFVLVIFLRY